MPITVRQFAVDDWEAFRDIRLLALQSDPSVFGRTYAEEVADAPEVWRDALANPDRAMFGVYDGDVLVGLTGIRMKKDDPAKAGLIASWLKPEYRGRGLSALMYEARLDWAQVHPTITHVHVSHRASNAASKAANQKYGFVYVATNTRTWPDGIEEDELHYVLQVKPA